MKKRILWIFATLLLVFISIFIAILMIVKYNHFWKYSADYESFSNEFNLVKDYIRKEYSDESDKWLAVSNNGSDGISLFDPDDKMYLVLPEDILLSLESIRNGAFPDKDSNFDKIRIQNGRVSFCIENGEYALVYSPDKKPTCVNSPQENVDVKVKAIADGWFHVTKDK